MHELTVLPTSLFTGNIMRKADHPALAAKLTVEKNLDFVEDPGGQKEILHFVNPDKGMLRISPHLKRTK